MEIPLKTPPALNPLQSRFYWLRPGFCVFSNPQKAAQPFLQPEPILQQPAAGRSAPQLPHVSPPLASCGCAFYYFSRLFYPLSILEKRNNNNSLPNLSTTHMNLVDFSYITPYLSFFFFFQSEFYFQVSNTEGNTPLLPLSDIFSIIPYQF